MIAPAYRRKTESEFDLLKMQCGLGNFVRSGHGRDLKRGLGHYVRGGTRGVLQMLRVAAGGQRFPDRTFDDWEQVLKEAETTPLFAIAEFASDLSRMTGALGRTRGS
jgi:hypothetical protein